MPTQDYRSDTGSRKFDQDRGAKAQHRSVPMLVTISISSHPVDSDTTQYCFGEQGIVLRKRGAHPRLPVGTKEMAKHGYVFCTYMLAFAANCSG
jgi:hypothetical protein